VWEQLESGRVNHRFESVVLIATLALIPVFVIEAEAKSSRWKDIAYAANWLIWLVFAAELAFILVVAPRKAAALRAHWLDAVIVAVTVPLFGRFLSSLRLLRLARLLRLLRLGAIFTRLVQRERAVSSGTALRIAALLTLLVVVIAGAVETLVDHSEVPSTWDGIWCGGDWIRARLPSPLRPYPGCGRTHASCFRRGTRHLRVQTLSRHL
jgi:voltage-gated potassium channel